MAGDVDYFSLMTYDYDAQKYVAHSMQRRAATHSNLIGCRRSSGGYHSPSPNSPLHWMRNAVERVRPPAHTLWGSSTRR